MSISAEDIEHLLVMDEVNEFLKYITTAEINKRVVVNLILLIFVKKEFQSPDWISEIVSFVAKDQFNSKMLTPTLKHIEGAENIFNEFVESIHVLYNRGKVFFNNSWITYDMFNEYFETLYTWFKDNFEVDI